MIRLVQGTRCAVSRCTAIATRQRLQPASSPSSSSSPWGPAGSDDNTNPYAVHKSDLQAARSGHVGSKSGPSASGQGLGVFSESEENDLEMLINNFTAPALARALREREATLHTAAHLLEAKDHDELTRVLRPFMRKSVEQRRVVKTDWDVSRGFTKRELAKMQRQLHRMPREVFQAATKRASVVIPLCNVDGVASVLFERRSEVVRTHKNEVCFPGGMVDKEDGTIIETSLREMQEEIGIPPERVEVLGVLRCNWDEVANMTGIAVTPVVGFIGEFEDLAPLVKTNPDEVGAIFCVPLETMLDKNKWVINDYATPVFTGGPYVIWGLTAYLLHRFLRDIVMKCNGSTDKL